MTRGPNQRRVFIVGAGGEPGVNMFNALRHTGWDPVAITLDDETKHFFPEGDRRYVSDMSDPDEVFFNLHRWWKIEDGPPLMFPASTKVLDYVLDWRDARLCRTHLPSRDTIDKCSNKAATYYMLDQPKIVLYNDSYIAYAEDELGPYPHWYRATEGSGAAAASRIDSKEMGLAWFHYWHSRDPYKLLMAEPYREGRNFGMKSLWHEGELVALMMMERVAWGNTSAPSGIPGTPMCARILTPNDNGAYRAARAAIAAIDIVDEEAHGPFCVDLIDTHVTEINAGRLTTLGAHAWPHANLPVIWAYIAKNGPLNRRRGMGEAWIGEPTTIVRNRSAEVVISE